MTLSSLRQKFLAGETNPESTIRDLANNIATRDKQTGAYLSHDLESALAEASKADLSLPLGGIPIGIKDNINVLGQPCTCGSKFLAENYLSPYDATVIRKLRAAGAIPFGRLNMDEFAMGSATENSALQTTRNPHGHSRIPGGSSGGSAAAVADRTAIATLGSDTGGSIRIPAALNGLVGFKNTARRVPTLGAVPLSTTMDTICAMTRSVRDAILTHEILATRTVARSSRPLSSYRLAVPTHLMLDGMEAGVQKAWERSLSRLSQAGAQIVEIELSEINELASLLATGGFSAAESYTWHRHLLAKDAAGYDPRVSARIVRGANMKAFEYLDLQAGRAAWIARMQSALNFCDAALSPTVPIYGPTLESVAPGPERDDAFFAANALLLRNTSVVNMLDGCALSLPIHEAGELPSSMMVWQGPMKDDAVLNISLAIESALST